MKRLSRSDRETLVGGGVFVVIVAFLVFAFTGGGPVGGYQVSAHFRQVDGLGVGSAVHLAGMKVGQVSRLRFDAKTSRAVVTMRIDSAVRLPDDTSAQVVTDGLLGPKFIKLVPGGQEAMIPSGGSIVYVQDGIIIERLLEKLIKNAEVVRKERIEKLSKCKCGDGAGDGSGAGGNE